jgi:plastocyanin
MGVCGRRFPPAIDRLAGVRAGFLVLLAAAVVAIAGCGGSSSPSKPPRSALRGQIVMLAANPGGDLKYDKQTLHVKAGTVTIVFTNASPVVHNVTISDSSGILGATPTFDSGEKTLTLKLRSGTYTFYCSVAGHEAAGMKGSLVVQ